MEKRESVRIISLDKILEDRNASGKRGRVFEGGARESCAFRYERNRTISPPPMNPFLFETSKQRRGF